MDDVVILFLKNPEPGKVKTRLAKAVGNEQAAAIFRVLAEGTIRNLPTELTPVVFFDPPEGETAVRAWLDGKLPDGTLFFPQVSGDLGERMEAAFGEVFRRGATRALIVGTDCPELRKSHYEDALSGLDDHDAVMSPTHDGGYCLLGLKRVEGCFFRGVAWSSPDTLAQSLERAREAGVKVRLLERLGDVDEIHDWERVAKQQGLVYKLTSMTTDRPIRFVPQFFERVWGGRALEVVFRKPLPSEVPIGESWELVDRDEAQSTVADGDLAGRTIGELWRNSRTEVFGQRHADAGDRFPLLIKLLDAQDKLSVQVHPPADVAPQLGGEPKTEMWHMLHCSDDADIYAGLAKGVTKENFVASLSDGTVEDRVHRIPVKAGDTIFIPSGRVHAIGAGNVILEVQQNSDTTYRVFDWNRLGLDGEPRQLHIEESMRSIDFDDIEPSLQPEAGEMLCENYLFKVERWQLDAAREGMPAGDFAVFVCVAGVVQCGDATFSPGELFMLPACAKHRELLPAADATVVIRTVIA